MANGPDEHLKRWTAQRRAGLVMEILRGDISVAEAARKHGVTVAELLTTALIANIVVANSCGKASPKY